MTPDAGREDRRGSDRVATVTSRILVVDDSRAIRQILRRSLEELGYLVAEAADGVDALAACRTERPDLVLLDVDMPVMDGLTALREMREDSELASLPVIFLTARTTGDDVAIGLGLGAQDYLRKPCHPAELAARVSSVLRLKAAEDALQQHANELDQLSMTDTLTGLGNRRRLELDSQELMAISGSSGLAGLIMIDIDHFKKVNDTEGHPVGDLVLRIVADRLRGNVSPPATIARWGGEEFLVLAPGLEIGEVTELGERLRSAICQSPLAIGDGRTLTITISVGCSLGPLDTLYEAIRVADEALYEAKRTGRNRVTTRAMNA
jgi:two-component system, cell cycle response regulator